MGITVLQAPQASGFISAHEDVWHVVDSTNKNVPGFKYLFDIFKGSDRLARVATSPYGNDGYGVLNVGNIVRSTLKFPSLETINTTTAYNNNMPLENFNLDYFFTEYEVLYGEVCGVTNLGEPIILENLENDTYEVYNTYNRHKIHNADLNLVDIGIYTNRPDTSYYYEGEPVVMNLMGSSFGSQLDLDIYDPNESAYNPALADGYYRFCLNGMNKDEITIIVRRGNTNLDTKVLIKKCSKYKPYTLFFINAYGVWDSFTFVNGNILTENEKKRFERSEWELSGSNMVNKFGKMVNEGMRTYATKFKTKMKLTSDILNSDEYKWLFELVVSPMVYLWDKRSSLFHPVQITDTNYEIKNSLQNKTEFLEVNIDVYDQNTQYR